MRFKEYLKLNEAEKIAYINKDLNKVLQMKKGREFTVVLGYVLHFYMMSDPL